MVPVGGICDPLGTCCSWFTMNMYFKYLEMFFDWVHVLSVLVRFCTTWCFRKGHLLLIYTCCHKVLKLIMILTWFFYCKLVRIFRYRNIFNCQNKRVKTTEHQIHVYWYISEHLLIEVILVCVVVLHISCLYCEVIMIMSFKVSVFILFQSTKIVWKVLCSWELAQVYFLQKQIQRNKKMLPPYNWWYLVTWNTLSLA